MEEWFSLMSNHQLAINWKQWLLFACFRVYIPNWVTLKLSVLSPHNIKINHRQQQQKPPQFFAHPKQNSWGTLLHSVAVCFFSVSSLFVKSAVVFHRPFWPWQITLDGLSSFSFWIIWARHDGGSQIAHGNGFPYYFRGLNVNTTVATMGTHVLIILGAILKVVYNLHCLLVLGSKGRCWFQWTLIFTPQVDSYFVQNGWKRILKP